MNERFMRSIVFFDLPNDTGTDRRNYNRFRRYLIKSGFMMMQESVYCKLHLNSSAMAGSLADLRKHKPPNGLVQILNITEKQYARIEFLTGNYEGEVINSDERLVVL